MRQQKEIRLLALDMDGTFLNSDKTVSNRNMEALKSVIRQGILVVPTTGRTMTAIPEPVRKINDIRYAICSNGAMVMDLMENRLLMSRGVEKDLALAVTDFMGSFDVILDVFLDGKVWTEERNLHRMDEFHLDEGTRQLILSTRHAVPDLRKHIEDAKCIIERFNMFYRNGEEKAEILEGLGQRFPELIVTSSLFQNLEINGPGANKGNALTWLCEYLGMTSEQAMVIGDNLNDLSAIQCAGLGIAMGNAIDEVKVIADAVTGNNNEAGVADAIYRYLLK